MKNKNPVLYNLFSSFGEFSSIEPNIASYNNNTYSAIDYDDDTMTFSNTSSVNNIINRAFNFTYNGNTNYSSGGVSQPIIAGCF